MPPVLEQHPALAILAIWLVASAIFIGVPLALTLFRMRRFIPSKSDVPLDALAGREVWIESAGLNKAIKTRARVASVSGRILHLDGIDAATFEPLRESRSFAAGHGSATGRVHHAGREARALLILL
jgi:hypothetical protein